MRAIHPRGYLIFATLPDAGSGWLLWGDDHRERDRLLAARGRGFLFSTRREMAAFIASRTRSVLDGTPWYDALRVRVRRTGVRALPRVPTHFSLSDVERTLSRPRRGLSRRACSDAVNAINLLGDVAYTVRDEAALRSMRRGETALDRFAEDATFAGMGRRRGALFRAACDDYHRDRDAAAGRREKARVAFRTTNNCADILETHDGAVVHRQFVALRRTMEKRIVRRG